MLQASREGTFTSLNWGSRAENRPLAHREEEREAPVSEFLLLPIRGPLNHVHYLITPYPGVNRAGTACQVTA